MAGCVVLKTRLWKLWIRLLTKIKMSVEYGCSCIFLGSLYDMIHSVVECQQASLDNFIQWVLYYASNINVVGSCSYNAWKIVTQWHVQTWAHILVHTCTLPWTFRSYSSYDHSLARVMWFNNEQTESLKETYTYMTYLTIDYCYNRLKVSGGLINNFLIETINIM